MSDPSDLIWFRSDGAAALLAGHLIPSAIALVRSRDVLGFRAQHYDRAQKTLTVEGLGALRADVLFTVQDGVLSWCSSAHPLL